MRRLLPGLLRLLLQLRHLSPGLLQRNILHQHRLCQNIKCILVAAQLAVQQRLGVGVFSCNCVWLIFSTREFKSCSSWGVTA